MNQTYLESPTEKKHSIAIERIKAITKLLLLIAVLSTQMLEVIGQDSLRRRADLITFEIAAGATHLSEDYIMPENKQWGVAINLGVRFESRNHKFAFTPVFGLRECQVDVEDVNNCMDIFSGGALFDFSIYSNQAKTFFIYNTFELSYAYVRNYLSQRDNNQTGYGGFGQQNTSYDAQTLYSGKAASFVIGYKLKYKMFFASVNYNIIKCRITYDNFALNSMRASNPGMDLHPSIPFNSLNIQVGLSLPFRMMPGSFWRGRSLY